MTPLNHSPDFALRDIEAFVPLKGADDLDRWWVTPIPHFKGLTPHEVWNTLGPQALYDYVVTYHDPSFT